MPQISFPPDMLPIEKWKAFIGKYPPNSDTEHRIIIVYKHGNAIQYFYITSQIEKARKLLKHDIGALVDGINGDDWEALTTNCCIRCNKASLYNTSAEDLRKAYSENNLKVLGNIPEKIKRKIISAVCASKSFTDTEKAIYTT